MSASFLSKLIRISTTQIYHDYHPNFKLYSLVASSQSKNRLNFRLQKQKNLPTLTAQMFNPYCACSNFCHFPYLSRYYSSFSSSDSDDGNKEDGKINVATAEKSLNDSVPKPATKNVPPPPPGPVSASNYKSQSEVIRPLDEHQAGLLGARRGRVIKPVEPTPNKQSPPRKDRHKTNPDDNKPTSPPKRSPSFGRPSRKRAKDRLEALTKEDCDRRLFFAYKLLLMIDNEPDILDNILWTDECNFNLPKLPSLISKPPVSESESLPQIAWCGITTKGTIGPYFFNSHVTGASRHRVNT